jgi:hypothetical protein
VENSPAEKPVIWARLRNEMSVLTTEAEDRYGSLLAFFARAESIGGRIVTGGRSLAFGDRPWEYVATIITSNAARLAIAGVSLSLGGYPDCSAILTRTLWESRLRLTWMCRDRLTRSLRFLWADADSEVRAFQAQPENVTRDQDALLSTWVGYRTKILQHGLRLGVAEAEIAEGLPKVATLATELGEKTRHNTWYARYSQMAHGITASLTGFLSAAKQRGGENGIIFPTRLYRLKALHSLGSELFSVLIEAARLVCEHDLEEEAHSTVHEMDDEFLKMHLADPQERAVEEQIREQLKAEANAALATQTESDKPPKLEE